MYEFKQMLMNRYEMHDLGELSWFLGIRILRDRAARKLWLCQDAYFDKVAERYVFRPRLETSVSGNHTCRSWNRQH